MFESLTGASDILIPVLGHSLWQAALVSGLVWLILRMIPAKHAERRHAIALGGLATIVMLTMTTWSVLCLDLQVHPVAVKTQSATSNDSMLLLPDRPYDNALDLQVEALPDSALNTASEFVPASKTDRESETDRRSGRAWRVTTQWLSGLWLCGSIVMLLRGLRGFVTVRQWLAEAKVFEGVDTSLLNQIVAELSAKLRLRRIVKVLPCSRIDTPAVIGVLWPVILIPVAMLAGVPVEQWRIMIAHELAHVRRWDPLVGLIQMVVESLLFFNPSVWWISRMVRAEREACCDAEAARICGQPLSVCVKY